MRFIIGVKFARSAKRVTNAIAVGHHGTPGNPREVAKNRVAIAVTIVTIHI